MRRSYKVAATVSVALGLGLAAAVFAHPGTTGNETGMRGGMGRGMAMHGGTAGQGIGQQIMTPEERTALMEKMRSAKTPEERQQLAAATHAEMQKRAKEKGITLPEQHGPRGRFGTGPGGTPTAPSTNEHNH